MAACLNCGFRYARIVYSRTFDLPEGGKETHRISICASIERGGCGQQRFQVVVDKGTTSQRWIEPMDGHRGKVLVKLERRR